MHTLGMVSSTSFTCVTTSEDLFTAGFPKVGQVASLGAMIDIHEPLAVKELQGATMRSFFETDTRYSGVDVVLKLSPDF